MSAPCSLIEFNGCMPPLGQDQQFGLRYLKYLNVRLPVGERKHCSGEIGFPSNNPRRTITLGGLKCWVTT